MDTIILVIVVCIAVISAYTIGIKNGQKIINKEEVTVTNPIMEVKEFVQNIETEKENKLEQRKYDTMLENIDKYDGTGLGQEEIPK